LVHKRVSWKIFWLGDKYNPVTLASSRGLGNIHTARGINLLLKFIILLRDEICFGVEPILLRPVLHKFIQNVTTCLFVTDMCHLRQPINPDVLGNSNVLDGNSEARPEDITLLEHLSPLGMVIFDDLLHELELAATTGGVDLEGVLRGRVLLPYEVFGFFLFGVLAFCLFFGLFNIGLHRINYIINPFARL
jgi:hypothetical protein